MGKYLDTGCLGSAEPVSADSMFLLLPILLEKKYRIEIMDKIIDRSANMKPLQDIPENRA